MVVASVGRSRPILRLRLFVLRWIAGVHFAAVGSIVRPTARGRFAIFAQGGQSAGRSVVPYVPSTVVSRPLLLSAVAFGSPALLY